MTETAKTVGDVVAARVRKYRELNGWSVRQLAERCAGLGAPQLTQSSLANIERGQAVDAKRQRREVLVEELLILAYALSVPPVLLLLPLGEEDEVTIVPNVTVHPDLALKWIDGDEPPVTSDRVVTGDLAAWQRAALPLRLYRDLRRAQDSMAKAEREVRRAEYTGSPEPIQRARNERVEAFRDLATVLDAMTEASMLAPKMPREWVDAMRELDLLHHPRSVRIFNQDGGDRA